MNGKSIEVTFWVLSRNESSDEKGKMNIKQMEFLEYETACNNEASFSWCSVRFVGKSFFLFWYLNEVFADSMSIHNPGSKSLDRQTHIKVNYNFVIVHNEKCSRFLRGILPSWLENSTWKNRRRIIKRNELKKINKRWTESKWIFRSFQYVIKRLTFINVIAIIHTCEQSKQRKTKNKYRRSKK